MKNIIYEFLNNILSIISNTLFPITCAVCKADGKYLCAACESKLELHYILNKNAEKTYGPVNNISNSAWIYAKYKYQNYNLKKIEYKIKYNHHPKLAEIMGEYSYEFIYKNIIIKNNLNTKNIFLVPIPISRNRLKERGYNQTEYIVKGINKMNPHFKILNILSRENTKKLKDVYGVDNRSEEIRNSMSIDNLELKDILLKNKIGINNLKLKENIFILIDDITTTGSTFYEARRTLAEYGISEKNIYGYALTH